MSSPELGFGVMRLPLCSGKINMRKTSALIQEYMQGGFCYFDTHPWYMDGKSQDVIRELVVNKYPRESFQLANKMPYTVKKFSDYETIFTQELYACGVSYFDYYLLHALQKEPYELHEQLGGFSFLLQKKLEGKIRKIGFSFHDNPILLETILKKHTEIDFVQLQINYLDWESPVIASRKCYEIARKFNKEIVVMEPIKGGGLARQAEFIFDKSTLANLALSFVANLPGISVILSGMSESEHVKENRHALLNRHRYEIKVYDQLRAQFQKQRSIQCTACQYCTKGCPKGIAIPDILALLNDYENSDMTNISGGRYVLLYNAIASRAAKASDCIQCGKCEERCPQKIKIRSYMHKAARVFEPKASHLKYYSSERNVQILIYLMKQHGIKKVVASPGATNICFVYSIQQDGDFEIYSAADERSAAYLACGLAAETGEPVAISCTGATASRNYMPALTEAYYRKLPILAITSTQPECRIGHNMPQVIDRTILPRDVAKMSVSLPIVYNAEDEWSCEIRINTALLELNHRAPGPVHINLATTYSNDFSVRFLPSARVIKRISDRCQLPDIYGGRIAIFVGAHPKWEHDLVEAVDRFCEIYNAVVVCDHTSNYTGKYGVLGGLILQQEKDMSNLNDLDLLIHLGEVSGAYLNLKAQHVWRVSTDGTICDTFHKLQYVFDLTEIVFFTRYCEKAGQSSVVCSFAKEWQQIYNGLLSKIPELPFSNAWIAKVTSQKLPTESSLHLAILNTLRCWNFFPIANSIDTYCNTGGFGIDGCVSTLIGASLRDPGRLYIGIVGDLAFFYDMNSLGSRHIGRNLRLVIVNNGCGTEFKNYNHFSAQFGKMADAYIAAAGHYGNQSPFLIKHYAEDLGFQYLCASSKDEYEGILPVLVDKEIGEKPLLVELFINSEDESAALKAIYTITGTETHNTVSMPFVQPKRISIQNIKWNVVIWGTGQSFRKNIFEICTYCSVRYVCDNDSSKWGQEIVPGIICISPKQLSTMEDIFVVIAVDDRRPAFQIANQLLDMGVSTFDLIYNWTDYAEQMDFK